MSTDRDVTRIVRSWLDEGVTQLPDRVLDLVLDQIPTTPQRRAGWLARRSPLVSNTVRIALAAAAVAVVALLGYQFFRSNVGSEGPAGSPSPSVLVRDFSGYPGGGTELDPGVYRISYASPVLITITVPDEPYESNPSAWYKALFEWGPWHQSNDAQLGFARVENFFEDPCVPELGMRDPAVGPTVDDLAAAITALPGVEVTGPSDVSLDGVSGQLIELTGIERPADCAAEAPMWETTRGDSWILPGVGGRVRVWILDVADTRLVVWANEDPGFTDQAALQSLVDSIQIE